MKSHIFSRPMVQNTLATNAVVLAIGFRTRTIRIYFCLYRTFHTLLSIDHDASFKTCGVYQVGI